MDGIRCWLLLTAGLLAVLGCAALPLPEQPAPAAPYALVEFPPAMQLLAIDDQIIPSRAVVRRLRVNPGRHTLRFAYVAVGPGASPEHRGQQAAPFVLEVGEGMHYHFVAKT